MPGMKKNYDRIWRPKSKASEGPKKSMPRTKNAAAEGPKKSMRGKSGMAPRRVKSSRLTVRKPGMR